MRPIMMTMMDILHQATITTTRKRCFHVSSITTTTTTTTTTRAFFSTRNNYNTLLQPKKGAARDDDAYANNDIVNASSSSSSSSKHCTIDLYHSFLPTTTTSSSSSSFTTIIKNVHFNVTKKRLFSSSSCRNDDEKKSSSNLKCAPSLKASIAGRNAFNLRHDDDDDDTTTTTTMATFLSHAGLSLPQQQQQQQHLNEHNKPLSPPLEFATTYERPPDGNYTTNGNIYGRMDNITRETLECVVGQMEILQSTTKKKKKKTEEEEEVVVVTTAAFSSGMAAVHSLLLSHLPPPPTSSSSSSSTTTKLHILLPDDVYHGVPTQFYNILHSIRGVTWSMVDMTNIPKVHQVLTNKLTEMKKKEDECSESREVIVVWMETPSNPLCKVTDIEGICDMVNTVRKQEEEEDDETTTKEIKEKKNTTKVMITTVVDSTWAPPCITQPLLIGADAVLHSATKYFGGHSDVLLGIVSCSPYTPAGKYLSQTLPTVQTTVGAVTSPFDCWLTLRGLRTLHVRLQKQCSSALSLASFLETHEHVTKVHYPGLSSHPQHEIALKQMKNHWYGGMLSFEVQNEEMACAVAGAVKVVKRATSLGGTETLIEHRASIEPVDRVTSPLGLLRVSVGLEDVEDLKEDLDRALDVASRLCC